MTHRQRVIAALSHEAPDCVPMDLGGSLASAIVGEAYPALRAELGLPERKGEETTRYLSLAEVEDDVREALDVDIIHAPRAFGVGRLINTVSENTFIDEWGVRWHKPDRGHYYVERAPFEKEATPAAVERFQWPKLPQLVQTDGLADRVRELREKTDWAISLELRGRTVSVGQFLRGFEMWMTDLVDNEPFVEALLERTTQLQIEVNDAILHEAGDLVDVVYTSDDFGGQEGPLFSPGCWQRLFRPHFKRIWEHIRANTSAKLMHHCCGSIYPFIRDFIDLGVQALNPIQVSAADMDPAKLKAEFGNHLCFWGGIDTHRVMPRGSTDDVRAEVARRIRQMGPGGGYILAAVHNLQPEVPPANIIAMFRAGRELGRYPLRV